MKARLNQKRALDSAFLVFFFERDDLSFLIIKIKKRNYKRDDYLHDFMGNELNMNHMPFVLD